MEGAIEISQLPETDSNGNVFQGRYILSCDPYDDDHAETLSLGSLYVLDLWTDKLVAWYTGRPLMADDFFEKARKLTAFYRGIMNYENNKKGLYSHFSKMNSRFLLAENP
jgi:hypothetical protein